MEKKKRWHPSDESDELVFAVCDRFLAQLDEQYNPKSANARGGRRGAAAAIAEWLRKEWHRPDLTREKIYPLFWEAARRRFLLLQPPLELHLAQRVKDRYGVGQEPGDAREVQVVNARSAEAIRHVTSAGAKLILSLVEKLGKKKETVHIGLGAGYSAMMVARSLADRVRSNRDCPNLVLHALSAGGFQVDKPQRSPITYFSYFDGALAKVDFVALFSHTMAPTDDYERFRQSPGAKRAFDLAAEIDIVVTSFGWAPDRHCMLRQFIEQLIEAGELEPDTIQRMIEAGWIGDVQFRPYTAQGPMLEGYPVRAVTLFELADLVQMAGTDGKHVVLLARPCGECGTVKTEALRPLLTEPSLRLWTHLVLDVDTASDLLKTPVVEAEPEEVAR